MIHRASQLLRLLLMTVAICIGLAPSANAVPWTLDSAQLGVNTGSAILNFFPVTDLSGTTTTLDGSVTAGAFNTAATDTQDVLVFRVEYVSGAAVDSIGVGQFIEFAQGLGHFNDPNSTPNCSLAGPNSTSAGSVGTITNCGQGSTTAAEFYYDAVALSGMSDRLFVTYGVDELPGAGLGGFPAQTVQFMINGSFTHTAGITIVPEPGTLMLLGAGLAGLALMRRRETA